ncbi:MAG: cytochrome C [Flavobacteriales bacterium MED-G15]|jgi:mono/diheme cytochrome c family protein|nr:MAG: cytochrome C [Flavobacteriales bacterium MED-G15]|tara:strand:- start:1753 stop:2232 length:480 start_codon:yes stop_codon:yes gene_type:complete
MKNPILFIIPLALMISCGPKKEKKKEFEYKRTQTEAPVEKKQVEKAPMDIQNNGIGPIKTMSFDKKIDDALAKEGSGVFKQKCTACHMADRKLIGPAMKGIYDRRSPAWVMNMILNPTEMLQKDPTAIALLKEYNNVMMLNQNLTQKEARALAEYFRTL